MQRTSLGSAWGLLPTAMLALGLVTPRVADATARYRLEVENTWSEETHPGAFPDAAHFSFLAGATHAPGFSFWSEGALAGPGTQRMAETGETDLLVQELDAAVAAGAAGSTLSWPWWFCPEATQHASCGESRVEFEIAEASARISLATMLGPSPDWFVGIDGLPLRADGRWLPQVVVDLRPYDGGTRSADRFALFGPLTEPPEPISPITAASGQRIGPASLGSLTFTLVPACDDRLDNDGDGFTDFPEDPGCSHPLGFEDPACSDGLDNDADGGIDWDGAGLGPADPHCGGPTDNLESDGCGLGFELVLLWPLLGGAARRRGRLG